MIDGVRRVAVATLLLVVSLLPRTSTGAESDHDVSRQTAPTTIAYVALGDSIAVGIGAAEPTEQGYTALLAGHLDDQFGLPVRRVNLAVPGETTSSMLSGDQLDRALRAITSAQRTGVRIGAVTLTIGANDLLRAGTSHPSREAALTTVRENVRTILHRIDDALATSFEAPMPALVVTGYYDPTESSPNEQGSDAWWLTRLDDTLSLVAHEAGARWVDVAEAFDGRTSELTWYPRDIHPNEAGHAVIAEAIWSILASGGALRAPSVAAPVSSMMQHAGRV